jgi:hypothetical protein
MICSRLQLARFVSSQFGLLAAPTLRLNASGAHLRNNVLMLRDKNLVPLSRQHQHALALCVRIDRALQAGEVDLGAWQAEIQQIVEQEIAIHFAVEEKEVFPLAEGFSDLRSLVAELKAEHQALRGFFAKASAREFDRHSLRTCLLYTLTLPTICSV